MQPMTREPELTSKQFLAQAILLFLLLIPAFPRVFIQGELLSSADILFEQPPWDRYAPENYVRPQNSLMFDPVMAFRPDYLLTKRTLANGEWPLWNPLEYGGVPLLANTQSTVFYPPRLLLTALDVDTAMTVFILLKLWLCGVTAFVCARVLRLSLAASRFFSIAWMLCSYNVIWANWPITDVSCWIPLLMAGAELLLGGRYRRGFAMMVLGGTLILLAGHPETAFTMSMGLGMYFALRLLMRVGSGLKTTTVDWESIWKPALLSLAAWFVALAVYTVQLAPFLEFLVHSFTFNERGGEEHAIQYPAGAVINYWVPRFYGTFAERTWWDKGKWNSNSNIVDQQYFGMTIWCGLAFLLTALSADSPLRRRAKQIVALLAASLTGILLAYYFPLFEFVHELPLFSSMLEIYHICFALFALPLLGSIGIEGWLSRKRRFRELWPLAPIAIVGVALAWFLLRFNKNVIAIAARGGIPGLQDYVQTQMFIAAALGAGAVAICALSCIWYRPRIIWFLFAVLFVVEHGIVCRGLNPTLPREQMYMRTELTDYLASLEKPCRVGVSQANLISGAVANYGIEEWLGYDGLFPERIIRYQNRLGAKVWDTVEPLHSIQYYCHDPDPRYKPLFPLEELVRNGRIERVAVCDGLEVYKNLAAFPRAFLVSNVETVRDKDELLRRMGEKGYLPGELALTESPPAGPLPRSAAASPGSAVIREYRSAKVTVDCKAERDAVLVLGDAYYPGWRATLDGDPAEIFPVYYIFRGVVVPPGEHTIEFTYFPASFRFGLAISSAALVVNLVICSIYLMRIRRTRHAA